MTDTLTITHFKFTHDQCPDLSHLMESSDEYAGNEIHRGGVPVPYDEYLRTYGDPNRYTVLVVWTGAKCQCCGTIVSIDCLGGVELYDEYPTLDLDTWHPLSDLVSETIWAAEVVREMLPEAVPS